MRALPFRSIAEAEENVSMLHGAFRFYSLRHLSDAYQLESPLRLERTQEITARALGCINWFDLVKTVKMEKPAPYFDSEGSPRARQIELATNLLPFLEHEEREQRIRAALSFSAFGCTPAARREAISKMKAFPCETVDQWHKLSMHSSGLSRAMRYMRGRSTDEIRWIHWEYEKAVALAMGAAPPKKPPGLRTPE